VETVYAGSWSLVNRTKAIVTLVVGDRYLHHWKNNCEANWNAYAARHGFDVICLDKPLDDSARARNRSPAWQKCLILGQDVLQKYERVVWLDADIVINHHAAPPIDAGVPIEKVGAVEEFSFARDHGPYPRQSLERLYSYWGKSIVNYSSKEYYANYGLPSGFDKVVQTGVLVLSPRHHRALLEKVYHDHEEKGGPEWNYEMRPLSYELLKADAVHWMDPRFNLVWVYSLFLHYPFLIDYKTDSSFGSRIKHKLATAVDAPSFNTVQRSCMTATFLNSFFFHIGGAGMEKLEFVNQTAGSISDCVL
jgi:hypothetical protein